MMMMMIYILIIMSRHQRRYPRPSLATPPYRPLLPAGLQGYIPYRHRTAVCRVRAGRSAFCLSMWRSTSLMSSSLLLKQYPACLVRLILIVFVMGGRWLYSCYFVGWCLQDLFNIARSILALLPSSFFTIRLVSFPVVHSYSRDKTRCLEETAFCFIGQVWFPYDR